MHIEGTLAKWNDDRGVGFIKPTQSGAGIYEYSEYAGRVNRQVEIESQTSGTVTTVESSDSLASAGESSEQPVSVFFHCDGRAHCSQMTSCAEAEFFLRNCPGDQMNGNHDGEPCEQQWCKWK